MTNALLSESDLITSHATVGTPVERSRSSSFLPRTPPPCRSTSTTPGGGAATNAVTSDKSSSGPFSSASTTRTLSSAKSDGLATTPKRADDVVGTVEPGHLDARVGGPGQGDHPVHRTIREQPLGAAHEQDGRELDRVPGDADRLGGGALPRGPGCGRHAHSLPDVTDTAGRRAAVPRTGSRPQPAAIPSGPGSQASWAPGAAAAETRDRADPPARRARAERRAACARPRAPRREAAGGQTEHGRRRDGGCDQQVRRDRVQRHVGVASRIAGAQTSWAATGSASAWATVRPHRADQRCASGPPRSTRPPVASTDSRKPSSPASHGSATRRTTTAAHSAGGRPVRAAERADPPRRPVPSPRRARRSATGAPGAPSPPSPPPPARPAVRAGDAARSRA